MPDDTWTQPSDVTDRWVGPDAPDNEQLLDTLIVDVERDLVRRAPDLQDRLADPDDTLEAADVVKVVARIIIRHLRNPDGTRQVTETAGPYAQNRTFAGDDPGALEVTDADLEQLGYPTGQRAFTIAPGTQETAWLAGGSFDG